MASYRNTVLLATATTLSLVGTVHADGIYGTAMIGMNSQWTDSEPYGENIAVDPDFPGRFDTEDGVVGALGIGYVLNPTFRIAGRLGQYRADINSQKFGTGAREGEEYVLDGDIESMTATIEGFYDFAMNEVFAPYLKAGIGVARNSYSARLGGAGVTDFDAFDGTADGYYDAYADETSTQLTWNVGLGGSLALNDRFTLIGEYQYTSLGNANTGQDDFTDGFQLDVSTHSVSLGARVKF